MKNGKKISDCRQKMKGMGAQESYAEDDSEDVQDDGERR